MYISYRKQQKENCVAESMNRQFMLSDKLWLHTCLIFGVINILCKSKLKTLIFSRSLYTINLRTSFSLCHEMLLFSGNYIFKTARQRNLPSHSYLWNHNHIRIFYDHCWEKNLHASWQTLSIRSPPQYHSSLLVGYLNFRQKKNN